MASSIPSVSRNNNILELHQKKSEIVLSNPTLNFLLSKPINETIQSKILPMSSLESNSTSYCENIRKMMHSFGDVRNPLTESAKLIENIVKQQMIMLINEAQFVAQIRKSSIIKIKDFLFLLKHDTHKLAKLIRYLMHKDMNSKLIPSVFSTENTSLKSKATIESIVWNNLINNKIDTGEKCFQMDFSELKRTKLCKDFLFTFVNVPYFNLEKLFDPQFVDDYTSSRNSRLNEFAQTMSIKDYFYYQSCRSVTFFGACGLKQFPSKMFRKFQKWILSQHDLNTEKKLEIKPTLYAWEVIQYFAHETVAILVELSLLVKREQHFQINIMPAYDKLSINNPARMSFDNSSKNNNYNVSSLRTGITPENILEAMRRFESRMNLLNCFGKSHRWLGGEQNRKRRILVLSA